MAEKLAGKEELEKSAGDLEEEGEKKNTLSYWMAHPEEAPGFKPPGQDQETDEEKEAREAAEAEAAAARVQEEETLEQKAAREAVEAEAAADKTKDWTVEDFRRGYKEAETRMHTATEETATERKAREAAEERAKVAEEKLAEQERLAREAARPKPLTEEDQDAVFEKAAEEIAELDRTDPDYLKNYARIWRRAVSKAGEHRAMPDADTLAEEAANKAWEKLQAKQAAESAKTAEERQRESQERLDQQANDFAKQSGLNMTPGSADYRLFWDIAHNDLGEQEFMKGDSPPQLEEQFKWCADKAKAIRGQVVEQTDAERAAVLAAQKNNQVLGKGSNPPPKEPVKPRSLSEMQIERASRGLM